MNFKTKIDTAILLVGGKGTRLGGLTENTPKPLIPFLNKPIVEYQIEALVRAGIKNIILCVGYKHKLIEEAAESWKKLHSINIKISLEEHALGTAGPIRLALKNFPEVTSLQTEKEKSNESKEVENGIVNENKECLYDDVSFIVMNTDIYSEIEINEFIKTYLESRKKFNNSIDCCISTTKKIKDCRRFGCLRIDEDGLITEFLEKPGYEIDLGQSLSSISDKEMDGKKPIKNTKIGKFINAGMYCISLKAIDELIKNVEEKNIETEVFPQLAKEHRICSFDLGDSVWADIGQFNSYIDAQKTLLKKITFELAKTPIKFLTEKDLKRFNQICTDNVVIGENVKIGKNTILKNATIFEGSKIGKNCDLNNVIVGFGVNIKEGTIIKNNNNKIVIFYKDNDKVIMA